MNSLDILSAIWEALVAIAQLIGGYFMLAVLAHFVAGFIRGRRDMRRWHYSRQQWHEVRRTYLGLDEPMPHDYWPHDRHGRN